MRKDTRASVEEAAITPIAQCGSELSIYNDIRVLISADVWNNNTTVETMSGLYTVIHLNVIFLCNCSA